ncbi:F0F1 ATP synthase subunit epsilon [Gorillibacterium timonense]|uniref:F0F1 ATP synthase subunit epsilon n=1 Tax=Gorillibacterium timonense TaxID=1689269 RepID=UPI00071D14B0|nr:F0F1 ATP synthase subunit epsilon [Gorillibacterium timonense]
MSTFRLEIVTPERKVFDHDVNMIVVEGVEGQLGILPNHIPLLTPLKISPVRIKTDGREEEVVALGGGFMEVRKDKVVILAETAELPTDIDLSRAEEAKRRAESRLLHQDEYDAVRAELALKRAVNRINVASHRH